MRVLSMAQEVEKAEQAEWSALSVDIVFHDVAKLACAEQDHGELGAQRKREYLTGRAYPPDWIDRVCQAIATRTMREPDELLEDKVL